MVALYRNRRAASIENGHLRVTVLEGGGHIAEIFDKASGVNPLWTPVWPSIEPASFGLKHQQAYGSGADGKLLAGLMGHNLCLDIFGGPSADEAAAGLTAHGEASVAMYDIERTDGELVMRASLPLAQLQIERRLTLVDRAVRIREVVESLSSCDRPVGWTQHVTLGPPFLEKGVTEFRASATRSKVFETVFGNADYLRLGAEFDWPMAPRMDGGSVDLRVFTNAPASNAYTTHLMDQSREEAYFVAFSPASRLAFGYVWGARDFPWMGIWEENLSRPHAPWAGTSITRGLEFGVSPMPEPRRQMIDRGKLFGVPTYRWIPAKRQVAVEYWAIAQTATAVPETLTRPGQASPQKASP
jgi:hypothetical protein